MSEPHVEHKRRFIRTTVLFWLLLIGTLLVTAPVLAEAVAVELRRTEHGWQLLRDGEPYFIRGAGGDASLSELAAAGANSIRTWGADGLEDRLDEAHRLGLTVTVGIWLGHERHGFDYGDAARVEAQFERVRETVLRYKDHPAVLLWGVGNEMEGFEAGDDPAVWQAVNDIAAMIKELDPHHPTMTVTAEIGGARIRNVNENCPDIDIHGINSYGGAPSLVERLREGGASKPFVLTEFGPPGAWEVPKNAWGVPTEPTSTEKAAYYRRTYESTVAGAPGLALGGYAFTWGYKMEATATWFGMFLPDGARLGAVDVMTELWSGRPPADLAPTVKPLTVVGEPEADPGDELEVRAFIADPEGGELRTQWALRAESSEYVTGGDFRAMMPDIDDAVLDSGPEGAKIRLPREPGPYRVFLYAYDEAGNAATANVPVLVKGERRTRLPFYVYRDGFEGMPWAPSGWMGSTDELTLDGRNEDDPYEGEASIKLRFTGEAGWVGVAWQHPANNWGDQDGGFDLTGATALEFRARGAYGGERIDFGVGLIGDDKPHPDSGRKTVTGTVLERDWRRYSVPLRGLDLSSIKTAFVVTLVARRGSAATVYLDDIRFVR